MPRIKRLEIKGFRAFGSQAQVLEFHSSLALIWGPNSKGKTSIAEAIEFLLTGKTVRRELVASAKREFAEALRNAHMPSNEDVIISAEIEDDAGHVHTVRRTLMQDYTGRDICQSNLTIDGTQASDLTSLGIQLSHPPLEAPVLMPHTLRYVVSADPQQRTEYFKALLEVSDLEDIRTTIFNAKNRLKPPSSSIEHIFQRCLENQKYGETLAKLRSDVYKTDTLIQIIGESVGQILSDTEPVPDGFEAQLKVAKALLEEQRSRTFPVTSLEPRKIPSWTFPNTSFWKPFEDFVKARSSVVKETSRLLRIFEEVIKVPELASAKLPIDCPVCDTPRALTPERIAFIRNKLESSAQFRKARQDTEQTLRELKRLAYRILQESQESCPPFFAWTDEERNRCNFNHTTIEALLGTTSSDLFPRWMEAISRLEAALEEVRNRTSEFQKTLEAVKLEEFNKSKLEELRLKIIDLSQTANNFVEALSRYTEASGPLVHALKSEIDRLAGMQGWQDLIDLGEHIVELANWLAKIAAYDQIIREIDAAIREIDQAMAKILDEKFDELSQEILRWWNLLRPDESTSFNGIQRGGTGRRYIDLKARLAAEPGSSPGGVLRDAVAVFSDSQLNCLGLAAFLARTVRQKTGFVILDDPVPASDGEHRACFVDNVLKELLELNVQVIILTHEYKMWKDVQDRYRYINPDTFQVNMNNAFLGARIQNDSNTLDSMLYRAAEDLRDTSPENLKKAAHSLRDAAERFCKEILVHNRRARGERVHISEYDGKALSELIDQVRPYLTKDHSHWGKLKVFPRRLNPGAHDDDIPQLGDLRQCLGDLKFLRKEYLP